MRYARIRALPDTYLLNFFQLSHMAVLAALVPWQIGMSAYGVFAATIALPSIAQSFFETFCLMSVVKHGRVDVIVRPVVIVVIPLLTLFGLAFALVLDHHIALLAAILTTSLFFKSLSFALVVSGGGGVAILARSELLTLSAYLAALAFLSLTGVRGSTVPMVMVSSGCFISAVYLLRYMQRNGILSAAVLFRKDSPKLSLASSGRIVASRSFEEGVLTFSPLMLATAISPVVAGQFRIFVSAVKLVYKLYPFRHDLLFVDVSRGKRGFREIAIVSLSVSGVSMALGCVGALFFDLGSNSWVWLMIASVGAIVSSLALFPVSADRDVRVLYVFLVGIVATHLISYFGFVPFLASLLLLSLGMLFSTLLVLRRCLVPGLRFGN